MSAAAASAVDPAAEPSPEARPSLSRRLRREHLEAPSPTIARSLLGRLLVHESVEGTTVGRIVETEAYDGPHDRASHSRAGRTPRTEVMFGAPGFAYVYLVYGMHHCLNVVCGPDGTASAVLIRALEPIEGLALMRRRRGATAGPDERLSAGPARLTQAMGIDRRHGGSDLVDGSTLYLADPSPPIDDLHVLVGPRIGVDYAGPEWAGRPWRFGVSGSPSLSRPFPDHR